MERRWKVFRNYKSSQVHKFSRSEVLQAKEYELISEAGNFQNSSKQANSPNIS